MVQCDLILLGRAISPLLLGTFKGACTFHFYLIIGGIFTFLTTLSQFSFAQSNITHPCRLYYGFDRRCRLFAFIVAIAVTSLIYLLIFRSQGLNVSKLRTMLQYYVSYKAVISEWAIEFLALVCALQCSCNQHSSVC